MKEIVNRLNEKRQIELAKSILESAGYKVSKINEAETDSVESLERKYSELSNNYSRYLSTTMTKRKVGRVRKFLTTILTDIFSKYEGEFEVYNKGFNYEREIGLIANNKGENIIDKLYQELDALLTSEGWRSKEKGVYIKDDVAELKFYSNSMWRFVATRPSECKVLDAEVTKDSPEDIKAAQLLDELEAVEKELEEARKRKAKNKSRLTGELSSKISNAGALYITVDEMIQGIESGDIDDEDGQVMESLDTVVSLLKTSPDKIFVVDENGDSEESSEAFDYLHDLMDSAKARTHKVVGDSSGVGDYRTHLYLYQSTEGKFVYSNTYGFETFYYL